MSDFGIGGTMGGMAIAWSRSFVAARRCYTALAIVAVIHTVISLFYYLRILAPRCF